MILPPEWRPFVTFNMTQPRPFQFSVNYNLSNWILSNFSYACNYDSAILGLPLVGTVANTG